MIPPTPIDEIRSIRRRLAAKFENNLDRIVADLRRQQDESGREFITLPPRRPEYADHTARSEDGNGKATDDR